MYSETALIVHFISVGKIHACMSYMPVRRTSEEITDILLCKVQATFVETKSKKGALRHQKSTFNSV